MIHALDRLQQELGLSEEALATHLAVPQDMIEAWRYGWAAPNTSDLRRLDDLLALGDDLANARNGKYRQA